MGVPSFYRWLVNKYPKVVADATGGGGEGFDNLYLDMNGLIHPCFHPDDHPFPPSAVDEVFRDIHDYVDRLFDIVKPRKLLFMAIDGVAPRAKMNQQRSRRFRSAKDAKIAEELEDRLRKQFENEGRAVLPKEESELFDSNVITPGTQFMHMLSENLRGYIKQRLNENAAWRNVKVILSDDKAPGEGEHKIMSFIRAQRASSQYDPNTKHCLYGLDADLIMLALATHEVHFSILREEVLPPNGELRNGTFQENCGRATTHSVKSRGWFKEHPWQPSSCEPVVEPAKLASRQEDNFCVSKRQAYQFLNISVLREYLAIDMEIPRFENFESDLERIIDDFIFICFFAGNDFLPHIPSLAIHEDCIDLLMDVYKKEFQNLGGYLVNMEKVDDKKGGYIKLSRVERFILAVGAYEEKIFSKRAHLRDKKLSRMLAEYREAKEDEKNCLDEGTSSEVLGIHDISSIDKLNISAPVVDADTVLENTKELKKKLKDLLKKQSDLFKDGSFGTDKVKFGTPGWRERYYKEKFCAENPTDMELMRKSVVANYGEGLCWVLLYYFSEVPSWKWFYPFHYGPCTSDFKGLSQLKVKFQKGFPFKPFDQLMAVLPPRSSHALPVAYKGLMVDKESKIIDFYPTEFEMDVDGKRFLWQGLCKLPLIDEARLLPETRKAEELLKDEERIRNEETPHQLILRRSSELRQQFSSCRERKNSEKIKGSIAIESQIEGIEGMLHVTREDLIESDDEKKYEDSPDDISMFYEIPRCFQNVPRLLEGVNIPEKIVCRNDLEEIVLWHERNRNGTLRTTSHNQKPDLAPEGTGRGFSFGRGKTSVAEENPSRNAAGMFRPYGDHGNMGRQQPARTYVPRSGSFRRDGHGGSEGLSKIVSNHRGTLSYRPYANNFCPSRGGGASEDWRVRNPSRDGWAGNYREVSGQRQHSFQAFVPNGGRGLGSQHTSQSFMPNVGRGQGGQRQHTSPLFTPNGGRGLGSQHTSQSFMPNVGRGQGDQRQHTSPLFAPNGGRGLGSQHTSQSFMPNVGRGQGDQRQHTSPLFTPNGGRGLGSQHTSQSFMPNVGRGQGDQRHHTSPLFAPNGGRGLGSQHTSQSFMPNVGRGQGDQRQHTSPLFTPNGGRGLGSQHTSQSFMPNVGRGQGDQRQHTSPLFTPNGGCGQGRGQGWYATKS
ncbi:5'-3' exoribonuclease 3-like isoform X2 [Salvia miltiorrhiza]|uniref:5'-3' exoribonuclease 3-like isoform X2 n=1 Tax=Salvia miltiorrhiza TaxID=226208 RepID=UPI0025ABFFAF|nr:5'-3' exoribonuclease 3-like isoform X2 [Salvia miltiorrhiza]XP_057807436.1 5'-3' exoribonuclease 3-like isoform X2 [Salvia miltiorrhiza]